MHSLAGDEEGHDEELDRTDRSCQPAALKGPFNFDALPLRLPLPMPLTPWVPCSQAVGLDSSGACIGALDHSGQGLVLIGHSWKEIGPQPAHARQGAGSRRTRPSTEEEHTGGTPDGAQWTRQGATQ